ncbi:MAG: redox-regulated ATPase YchF [Firmicutes bacterium]|nr:redox-regulated ATPase YchF [Bacillota bacterium]
MKLGVVGLPNVGKSTLFNAITNAGAQIANYPFCTIEPNVGIVNVPDERLAPLSKLYDSKKIVPTFVEFVDIAGLVKGANKGEGLGNKFLSHIREVDAIVHVVRCFFNENITHVENSIDPERDISIINLELILSDLESVQKKLDKAKNMTKTGDKKYAFETEILSKIYKHLESEKPVRLMKFTEEEKQYVKGLFLLTSKPIIYAANISENELNKENELVKKVQELSKEENAEVITICAKLEEELAGLNEEERKMFMSDLNLQTCGLNKLISACYKLLGLMSFLTSGPQETRAWTIEIGTKAPQAAGKIHTDFEKGFIKAEVINYKTLLEIGNYNLAKEKGKVRLEGKEYIMQDGDVVIFKFNV